MELDEYKQQVADLYSRRSSQYDKGNWHPRIAHRLVEYAQLSQGQQVLDIATGTGMVAIEAAQIVGNEGQVIGIDISPGMIDQAREKVKFLDLPNIEFHIGDAETLNFPPNTFDYIFCSSALIWMSDLLGALRLWHQFLRPGGVLGFHAFAETAFLGSTLAQKIFDKYDISLLFNKPTGTVEKCRSLLQQSGFEEIDINVEQDGSYITLESAKGMWWLSNDSFPIPGQYPNPLLKLTPDQRIQAQLEFNQELETLQTEQGIWNDITIFYVFGQKRV